MKALSKNEGIADAGDELSAQVEIVHPFFSIISGRGLRLRRESLQDASTLSQ
jgi:hypothetical protein